MIAIGGTGMAPLACLLQAEGHRVRGSDGPLYPPMSTLLAAAGIRPLSGFDASHLTPRPDLVVVGNAVRRDNPEVVATEAAGIARLSMPEALSRFFLAERRPLVVAGTHGKTTTSALAAWVWSACGADPGYLIGGLPVDLPASFHRGSGPRFVVEGDEYNAAFFDRGAKFLHYRPQTLILTSVEYDHADLYPSPAALHAAYEALIALLPADGLLIACGESPELRQLARRAPCPVLLYGLGPECDVRPVAPVAIGTAGMRLRVADPEAGEIELTVPLWGEHNVENVLAVWGAARRDGLPAPAVAAALARFHGVRRRLEVVGEAGGVVVIDDFAHHPTAVGKTLLALTQRFPGRRLVAVFEPRSLTAGRSFFFEAYCEAFSGADLVFLAPLFHRDRLAEGERLDREAMASVLARKGIPTRVCQSLAEVEAEAASTVRPGDVLVAMSSGEFGRLPEKILARLGGKRS